MNKITNLEQRFVETVLPTLLPGCVSDSIIKIVGLFNSKLSVELNSLAFKGTPYEATTNKFVHFTSLRALQSILNENSIRLYCLNNSNDPDEFTYYINGIENEFFNIKQIKENTFTFSMCDEKVLRGDNALNLWRLYGDGGRGVAIVFEIEMPVYEVENIYLGRVVYEKPKIDDFLKKNKEFELENKINVDFSDTIHVPACFHKNSHYRIEEEFRLMLHSDKSDIIAKFEYNNRHYLKDFNSRNEIVTYRNLSIGQTHNQYPKIQIKEIQIGFKHPKESYSDIYIHLETQMASMIKHGVWNADKLPVISHSDLVYR